MTGERPELSAVLATDRLDTAAEMIEHLRLRTDEAQLELVLVGIEGRVPDEPSPDGFAAVQTLAVPGTSLASARAAGVGAAGAPLVVLVETHCFPERGWARGLVERWREGWKVIGPAIDIENPSARSWASLIFDYGPFLDPDPGPCRNVPGHNSAYDRAKLLDGDIELAAALEDETLLHWRFASEGSPPYLDDRVRARHMNITHPAAAARLWFHHSRLFAARRSAGWPAARRLLYVAGSPLLPAVFLARVARDAARMGRLSEVARSAAFVIMCVTARAAGELTGYLTRRADPEAMNPYELHRASYADRSRSPAVPLSGGPR